MKWPTTACIFEENSLYLDTGSKRFDSMSRRINMSENRKVDKHFPTFKIIFSSFLKTCLLSLEAKDLEES